MRIAQWARRVAAVIAVAVSLTLSASPCWAVASIYLTGRDPDFHASLGGNLTGARNINNTAIDFITDPAFNSFTNTATFQFLFVESNIAVPSGNTIGKNGIIASGFGEGTDFEHHDATTLNAELNLLGTKYAGIVVASDFGGILTQAELDILNARSADIISFLNAGGGLYAMAESDRNGTGGLTPNGGHYGFLPFVVSSTGLGQSEIGHSVTAFGAGLGLTDSDVNGNASHNVFDATAGLNIVDVDAAGRITSLAGRGQIDPDRGLNNNAVPEPITATLGLMGLGVLGMATRRRAV